MGGKNIENAHQDLEEGSGIWPAIENRLTQLAYQGLLDTQRKTI